MNQFNSSVQSLFDVMASGIQARLLHGHSGDARVSWSEDNADRADRTPSDLIWWSWSLSIDSASRVVAGASWATWKEISGLAAEVAPADFGDVIQEAARGRFGLEVTCGAAESWEKPLAKWTSVSFCIEPAPDADLSIHVSISPDLEAALGGSAATDTEGSVEQHLAPRLAVANHSADILMHVEMPVTIILGCTTMRLKDLLKLTDGSVIELDQMLDEEVEVRVNNCVIAYGEVVAVEGNYAVRILRMAPAQNGDLRRGLPEKAA